MIIFAILSFMLFLLPELTFACPNHSIALDSVVPRSAGAIFFNLAILLTLTIPLGFIAGRTMKRLAPAGRIAILTFFIVGLLTVRIPSSWACHGAETVGSILKEVYAAQMDYQKKHGVYAASFEELGMVPSSIQYSYFLPSETLSAVNPLPKQGVDLSRLPDGVFPVAKTDKFTVVALAFVEPNRIDVWTMDQDKVFKEWSLPAVAKVERKPQMEEPATWQNTFKELTNKFEGPMMWMTLLLGLALGFNLSTRVSMMPRPASL